MDKLRLVIDAIGALSVLLTAVGSFWPAGKVKDALLHLGINLKAAKDAVKQ